MLISAKYAWYIIALQIVLALIADRKRWATYVVALLIPTVLIHGASPSPSPLVRSSAAIQSKAAAYSCK